MNGRKKRRKRILAAKKQKLDEKLAKINSDVHEVGRVEKQGKKGEKKEAIKESQVKQEENKRKQKSKPKSKSKKN